VSTASPLATSVFVKKMNFNKNMSTCSIFELETSFWCQKLRLDLLISGQASEKFSEVGNTVKIDPECGDFSRPYLFKKPNKKGKTKDEIQFLQFLS
jgi:hypothetical protein